MYSYEKDYSDFTLRVFSQIKKIPKGTTLSYKDVANLIGNPNAYRAVANACGKNPDPKNIPCHRVIKSDGSIGGYSLEGGINKKKYLLIKEKKCSKI
jgi:O-6-methylguanine DNA methyltransferase